MHALSRSKKEEYPDNVIHHHIDLQSSPDEMADEIKNVRGEYVFFAAYLAQDTEQKAWDVNGAMLSNFLQALVKTGAIQDVKRIILVTGAKQYGVHLGVPKQPMVESDPWLSDEKWPPNFYYNQQTILHQFCATHNKEWVVTYPNDVIGFATANFMNLSLALALYIQVSKELDTSNQGLTFPGSPTFYTKFDSFTSSKLHAEFCAWAALEPRAANQAFNVVNGDAESWQSLWPRITAYFDAKVNPTQFADTSSTVSSTVSSLSTWIVGSSSTSSSSSTTLHPTPPLATWAESSGLVSSPALAPSKLEQHIDLEKWSARPDVQAAWKALATRAGLDESVFEKATWGFLNFVLGRSFDLVISMSKARECGWTGYRDTYGAFEEVFAELKEGRVIAG